MKMWQLAAASHRENTDNVGIGNGSWRRLAAEAWRRRIEGSGEMAASGVAIGAWRVNEERKRDVARLPAAGWRRGGGFGPRWRLAAACVAATGVKSWRRSIVIVIKRIISGGSSVSVAHQRRSAAASAAKNGGS